MKEGDGRPWCAPLPYLPFCFITGGLGVEHSHGAWSNSMCRSSKDPVFPLFFPPLLKRTKGFPKSMISWWLTCGPWSASDHFQLSPSPLRMKEPSPVNIHHLRIHICLLPSTSLTSPLCFMLKMFGKSRFVLSSVITLCQAQIKMTVPNSFVGARMGLSPELHGSPGWDGGFLTQLGGGSGVGMSKESFQEEVVDDR